jgi:mRNA interferase MazF
MKKRDIVLVEVPYTDLSERKLRPALVLGRTQEDYLCCFISSNPKMRDDQDIAIRKNGQNNLRADSVIKCGKIFTLHQTLVERKIGSVGMAEYRSVIKMITQIIR